MISLELPKYVLLIVLSALAGALLEKRRQRWLLARSPWELIWIAAELFFLVAVAVLWSWEDSLAVRLGLFVILTLSVALRTLENRLRSPTDPGTT